VIQRDVLVANSSTVDIIACKPTYPLSVAVSCGAVERPTRLFVVIRIPTLHRTVTSRVSDFTLKCIRDFVVYLNIIERSNQLKSATGELLANKVVRAFNLPCFGLATSRRQVA